MIQFTNSQIENFRNKVKDNYSIVEKLEKEVDLIFKNPLQIPETGIANWSHYYYCNDCSVRLEYDFFDKEHHVCKSCGKVYTGEPYCGAWWRLTNAENYTACHKMGLLYALTGEKKWAEKSAEILLSFAKYYPDYEVHGDIPYNGPGKANAQTLCEATFLRTLAYGYDLIKDTLSEDDQKFIETNLLRCGAEFLVENRHDQIHNHEVITNSAIGVIGLILNNKEFIDFAIYGKYGLVYQLENGVLDDGMWFECSLGYHFYALQSFFAYEKFAQHTEHSQVMHPIYQKMFETSAKYILPDGSWPKINDTAPHHTPIDSHDLLEFAYASYKSELLLELLQIKYASEKRGDLESFFYGVEELEMAKVDCDKIEEYHCATGSGVSIIRDEPRQFLMLRHSPYGGEHDHYDRLAISYYYDNQPVSVDLGTTGYGAFYHYKYFKNTGTHNTVVINEENHAPSKGEVLKYERDSEHCFVDMQTKWTEDYEMPDSFVIKQWDDESYKNVVMRRQVYKAKDFIADVFTVENAPDKTIDWVMHFEGERNEQHQKTDIEKFSEKEPFCYFTNAKEVKVSNDVVKTSYVTNKLQTDVYSVLHETKMIYATGLNNPTSDSLEFMVQRAMGKKAIFTNVIATSEKENAKVKNVTISKNENCVIIEVEQANGKKTLTFDI